MLLPFTLKLEHSEINKSNQINFITKNIDPQGKRENYIMQNTVESRYMEVHGTVAKFRRDPKFDLMEVRY